MKISQKVILNEMKENQDQLLSWYYHLHQIPEVGLELPNTVAYVCSQLDGLDIPYQIFPNSSGITAVIGTKKPIIGIRADMDALDVQEETGLPYASTNGHMHACGHDSHIAILLTVAKVLKRHEKDLTGSVKLIFQTGEEILRGAKYMIAHGALANPTPDYMLALHAGSFCGEDFASGDIVLPENIAFYSSDSFRIVITGKGGHAASPHMSIDPIVTAGKVVEALQTLVSREVKPAIPAVISVTHISSGAQTYNVIPDEALMMGGVRTTDPEVRKYLKQRVTEVASQIAVSMRAEAQTEFVDGCPAVINDAKTTNEVFCAVSELFPDSVHWKKEGNGGSEDTSYYFEKVPGCFLFLASLGKENGQLYPHHHCKFRLDETVLWKGAAAMAGAAISLMEKGVSE